MAFLLGMTACPNEDRKTPNPEAGQRIPIDPDLRGVIIIFNFFFTLQAQVQRLGEMHPTSRNGSCALAEKPPLLAFCTCAVG